MSGEKKRSKREEKGKGIGKRERKISEGKRRETK